MPFFEYNQNNSGGSFVYDAKKGISHYVIVEANSAKDANNRAKGIGLYFDGEGDCPCCGDRWYEAYRDGDEVPSSYGKPIDLDAPMPNKGFTIKWMKNKFEGFVHYKDGSFRGFWATMAPKQTKK